MITEAQSFNTCVQEALQKYWDMDALTDYGVQTFQYKDVARVIEKLHIIFDNCGIQHGDKVAICGRNSAKWGITFLATLTYGAVAVPILNEFHPEQIQDIVNHSEAKLLFVGLFLPLLMALPIYNQAFPFYPSLQKLSVP